MKPAGPRKTLPNWKLNALFKHPILISKESIFLGKKVAIDEETLGYKSRHPNILRITYKKEGGGFQCHAMCSDGYIYSFYFRYQPAPEKFLDMGISPLHARYMVLLEQTKIPLYNWYRQSLHQRKICEVSLSSILFLINTSY